MERCTLCGGRLSNGRCTECGLDNTKNDKKYHLNTHNEKDTVFRHGDCEERLNKERPSGTGSGKLRTGTPAAKNSPSGKNSTSGGADSAPGKSTMTKAKRQKQLKERQNTGTVKKGGGKLIRWIIILVVLFELFGNLLMEKVEEVKNSGNDMIGVTIRTITGEEEESMEKPEEIIWNEASSGYFESGLTAGIYNVGYEIPAGSYQLYCEEGTVWGWYRETEDDYRTFFSLYSLEQQEWYAESFGECDSFELSGELNLEEGGVLCVEDCDEGVFIRGEGEGKASLSSYEPQNLKYTVTPTDGMVVGEDMTPGVYDIMLEELPTGEYGGASITVTNPSGESNSISLTGDSRMFYRCPFVEGSTVEVEKYGSNERNVRLCLIPSY
jgi:hypothetical protein